MSVPDLRPPYQGLTPFDERDAAYFFGRERDSRLIAADLFAAPFTVLYGASGVGKSSVLRAGVLPLLRQDPKVLAVIFGSWQVEPLAGLKRSIRDAAAAAVDEAERSRIHREMERLAGEPLIEYLSESSKLIRRRLLLILDQFEEYSLYHPQDDEFGMQLPDVASAADIAVSVMLSMREEAVSWLDRFEDRIPGLFDNRRRVDHLDRDAGRAAIERPLVRFNEEHPDEPRMSVEPMLVDLVLEEVVTGRVKLSEGGLGTIAATTAPDGRIEAPYLQLVMTRLWDEERRDVSPVLRVETFRRLGGAEQIVRDHLKHVMARLTEPERDLAMRVFQFLVTQSATKIAYSVSDLAATASVDRAELASVLEKLASGRDRILRPVAPPPDQPGEPRYEIFHDRLARPILEWRARRLKDKEVQEVKREQVQRQREQPVQFRSRHARDRQRGEGTAAGIPPPYTAIAAQMRSRGMVVVLGAGVSASVRPDGHEWRPKDPFAPTTWELIQLLAHDVKYPLDDGGDVSLPEVASYFQLVANRGFLGEALRNVFVPVDKPARFHRLLARESGSVPLVIVATTYDTLMEQALDEAGKPYEVLTSAVAPQRMVWRGVSGEALEVDPRDLRTAAEGDPRIPVIFKVFGSLNRLHPQLDRFIVTEEDEMELFAAWTVGKLPPPRIASALEEYPALFVGMGLRSWTQRLLLSRVRHTERSRRWTDWSIALNVSSVNAARWKAAGVELADLDVDAFTDGLERALESA